MLQPTGRIHASDLGGLAKSMPWTSRFCLVGAASISAFPLFSGLVSKSMIVAAALAEHHNWVWFILLFFSALAFTWLQRSGLYPPELHSTNLDSDWFLRRPIKRLVSATSAAVSPRVASVQRAARYRIKRADRYMPRNQGPYGVMTKTCPTGVTMVWVGVLLVGYLMLYYVQ
jgi:multicomponent Na+:H+ antiporter subunit D